MSGCNKYNELFEKAINGELNGPEEKIFYEHLDSCVKCSNEFYELKNTLELIKSNLFHESNEEFLENIWQTIEPKLIMKQSLLKNIFDYIDEILKLMFVWKYQLAVAAVLLAVGIFIGEYLTIGKPDKNKLSIPQNNNINIEQIHANTDAANYMERSKVLLIGLMNFDPETDDVETISLPRQKRISRELISQALELKAGLKKPEERQMKKLISDIELILLQIANLETKQDIDGIELIKDGVKNRGIIFKINIQEMKRSGTKTIPRIQNSQKENKNI